MADAWVKNRTSCKACSALGLMRFVYGWLEKRTSARDKFAPKTNLEVRSAELTCCFVYECEIRILTFLELPFAKYWESTWSKS
jgi:hypothetical protein